MPASKNSSDESTRTLVTREAIEFAKTLVGGAAKQFGEILADLGAYWRYKNFLNLRDKVADIHRKRKFEGKPTPIPPRYALPLIEKASMEDEPQLQDMWAGLIANFQDPRKRLNPRKIYFEILSEFEPLDTAILLFLAENRSTINEDDEKGQLLNAELLAEKLECDSEEVKLALSNLFRLGCIIDSWEQTIDGIEKGFSGNRVNNPSSSFRASYFGLTLVDACSVT